MDASAVNHAHSNMTAHRASSPAEIPPPLAHGETLGQSERPPTERISPTAFDGAVPPAWAFEHASRILERVDALPHQERRGVLLDLRLAAPTVACLVAVALSWREPEPALSRIFGWMYRGGRKTGHLALAQLLHRDSGLGRYVEETLRDSAAKTLE